MDDDLRRIVEHAMERELGIDCASLSIQTAESIYAAACEALAKIIEAQPVETFCTVAAQGQAKTQRAVYAAAVRAGRVLDYREAIAVMQALPVQEDNTK